MDSGVRVVSGTKKFDRGLTHLMHASGHGLAILSTRLVRWCTGVCTDRHLATLLADNLIPASDAAPRRLRLRSANRNCLTVPRCRLSTYGPTVWNSLPDEL